MCQVFLALSIHTTTDGYLVCHQILVQLLASFPLLQDGLFHPVQIVCHVWAILHQFALVIYHFEMLHEIRYYLSILLALG